MKVFSIKNDSINKDPVGYLVYYENPKSFYIELKDGLDPWDAPLLLSGFVERGEYSINSYWSGVWVKQRIIPAERQNIGEILKENNLSIYDEYEFLKLSNGRCVQDDYYLEEISDGLLPDNLLLRWKTKVADVIPLKESFVLVFFRNGEVKIVKIADLEDRHSELKPYLVNEELFNKVEVQTDGYGILWNEKTTVSHRELYEKGHIIPLSLDDFYSFVKYRIINTRQACQILGCSRQNIDDLIKRDKLHPIRTDDKNKLFSRNEVLQRRKR